MRLRFLSLCLFISVVADLAAGTLRSKRQLEAVPINTLSFSPTVGPKFGGTQVNITGTNINKITSGAVRLKSAFGDQTSQATYPLKIVSDKLMYFTMPAFSNDIGSEISLVVEIPGLDPATLTGFFQYKDDPQVTGVNPSDGIVSGGTVSVVSGYNLDSVQNPLLIIRPSPTSPPYISYCSVAKLQPDDGSAVYNCPLASLNSYSFPAQMPTTVSFGFKLDGIVIDKYQSKLNIYADPVMQPITGGVVSYSSLQDGALNIKGSQLKAVLKLSDQVFLTVGGKPCVDIAVGDSHIDCTVPQQSSGKAEVLFVMGNIRKSLGYVSFDAAGSSMSAGKVVAIVFGVGIGVVIIAIVIWAMLRRRKLKRLRKRPMPPSAFRVDNIYNEGTPRNNNNANNANTLGGTTTELVPLTASEAGTNGKGVTDFNEDFSQPGDGTFNHEKLLRSLKSSTLRENVREVLISPERLELGDLLGRGHFGQVYAGVLKDDGQRGLAPARVAVKTLQDNTMDTTAVEAFLSEGIIMKNFNHQHVLQLLGIAFDSNGHPMMILPFMAKGDLRTYVKNKDHNFTARELLQLTRQVAEGMAYLSSLSFVHRDLAARNCMIDECDIVKVADFGLSRQLYEKDYYSAKDRKLKLPIKWMALESLDQQVFTTKTDIWSFGVLMWELMTRGITPYPDVDPFDIRDYLSSGHRLRRPKFCPEKVYEIMMDCWNAEPVMRPTFTDLVNRIELILNPPKKDNRASTKEPQYFNVDKPNQDYLEPVGSPTGTLSNRPIEV